MSSAQECLKALRQGQLNLLVEHLREMENNYIKIYNEAKKTKILGKEETKILGEDDILPLMQNDLALADIDEEDLKKLFVLLTYLSCKDIDPGYSDEDNYKLTQLFKGAIFAFAAKKNEDYVKSLQAVSAENIDAIQNVQSDYHRLLGIETFEKNAVELFKNYFPANKDDEIGLLNKTLSQMRAANPADPFVVSVLREIKIKQLNTACDNYLTYLAELIRNHIRKEDRLLHDTIFKDEVIENVFIAETKTYEMKTIPCSSTHRLYEEVCNKNIESEGLEVLGTKDSTFKLALEKYKAVSAMKETLSAENESAADRIGNFKGSFQEHSGLLQTRRDSAAMTFLKVVATVLSLGIVLAVSNFWKPKSKETAEDIEHILTPKL